jgi:hypothetical protein
VTRTFWFLLAGLAVLTALSGCGGVPAMVIAGIGSAGSVYTVVDKITEATSPLIAAACAEYEKRRAVADALTITGRVPSAKVAAIESFGDAACGSGSGPPSGDPLATAIWLGELAGQIATLTSAAK